MCWYAYIATSKPLVNVVFTKDLPKDGQQPPSLHFEEVADEMDEAHCYRSLFKGNYLYYVGTDTGCGCGLALTKTAVYDQEDNLLEEYCETHTTPSAFIDFVQQYITLHEPLELYLVWETDRRTMPLETLEIVSTELSLDNYWWMESRYFYRFI